MTIDKIYQVAGMERENLNELTKVLDHIHSKAFGFSYSDVVPTDVPEGQVIIYDNGAGTKRIYFKTGKGNIGFVNLT
jgi:hypothetical protein